MYQLPPPAPSTPAEYAAAYEPLVALACAARKLHPRQPAAYVLIVPPDLDPKAHDAFWAAVAAEMRGTGWTLDVQGHEAYPVAA